MNHGVERQREKAVARRVAREDADAAAEQALTEGYTCQEKYDLGATCGNCTEGELPQPVRKMMFPPGVIETFSGDVYNFENPSQESIHLVDIAHALSNHCRYAGHTKRFYGVGEHSVLVSNILEAEGESPFIQMVGLFHDAHEAYVMDAPRPLKPLLGQAFKDVARRADAVIADWLSAIGGTFVSMEDFEHPVIKRADNMALVAERKQLMTAGPDEWEPGYESVPDLPPMVGYALGLPPEFVKQLFLIRARELGVSE